MPTHQRLGTTSQFDKRGEQLLDKPLSMAVKACLVMVSSVMSLGLFVASSAIAQEAPPTNTASPTEPSIPSETSSSVDSTSDDTPLDSAEAETAQEFSFAPESLRLIPLFRVGATTESGGTPASLTAFEGFFPLRQSPSRNVTFLNTRFNIDFDRDDSLGGTVLVGHRAYSPEWERVLGGYVSIDLRDTNESVFPQVGFGFERLGKDWDIRANGYVPVGDTRQQTDRDILTSTSSSSEIGDAEFNGNLLSSTFTTTTTDVFTQIDRFEAALGGFDLEAGTRLARWNQDGELRLYGGVYYLGGHDVSAVGGRGRLEITPTESVRFMAGVQGDPVFDVRGFFAASFLFPTPEVLRGQVDPDERDEAIAAVGETVNRLAEPVARNNSVVVDQQRDIEITESVSSVSEEIPFINPETGEPWRFIHVATGGSSDGTFEDPFGLLQDGLDATVGDGNDIVYVALDDDAEIEAFTIPDLVQVLSTGPEQELDATLAGTSISSVVLPGSNDGNFPDITDTVTAGNDTRLSGLEIVGVTGSAIVIPTGTSGVVEVSDSQLGSDVEDGIEVEEITDDIEILLVRNTFDEIADSAIDFGPISNGTVDITIQDSELQNVLDSGVDIDDVTGSASVNLDVSNNTFEAIGNGIDLNGFNAQSESNIAIVNNNISLADFEGVRIGESAGNAIVDVEISQNTVEDVGSDGISVGASAEDSDVNVEISSNTISATGLDGIRIEESAGNAGVAVEILENTIEAAGMNGIGISGTFDAAEVSVDIAGNEISDSLDNGIHFEGEFAGTSTVDVSIADTTVTNSGSSGVLFNSVVDEAQASILATNNTISGNQIDGIGFTNLQGFSETSIDITGNTISDNIDDGIVFSDIENSAVADITISDNLIEANGAQGIQLDDIQDSAIATLDISRNVISLSGAEGIRIDDIEDDSTVGITISENVIQDSGGDGIELDLIDDNAVAVVDISGNTIEGAGADGISIDIAGAADVDLMLSDNSIQSTDNEGVDIDNDSPTTTVTATGNTFADNAEPGFRLNNQGAGSVCLLLEGNTGSNVSVADFELINANTAPNFEVVELDGITLANVGSFDPADIETNLNFTNVASCAP